MRRGGFLRSPAPVWTLQPHDGSEEASALANRALKLFEMRRLIWRVNLALVGLLLVTQVSLKFVLPGFPAAEYLATEIGVLEAVTLVITRRMTKKEEQLERDFLREIGTDP